MAELLYRLGRFSARRAWLIIISWGAALLVVGLAFAFAGGTLSTAIDIPGTATQDTSDRLKEKLPEAAGGVGTVVFHTANGEFTDQQREAMSAAIANAASADGIQTVIDPFQSETERQELQTQIAEGREQITAGQAELDQGQTQLDAGIEQAEAAGALATMQAEFDAQQAELDAGQAELDAQEQELESGAAQLDLAAGLRTVSEDGSAAVAAVIFNDAILDVTTEVKEGLQEKFDAESIDGVKIEYSAEIVQSIEGLLGVSELVGLAIAAIVLIVMLGTLVTAGLPILTAVIGVGVSILGALAFSNVVDMVSVTPILGVMLGLAVGIDYSLFILNRHRRQLREGMEVEESIGLANGTSGNAVVFAGTTVFIALIALNVTGIGFLGLMGTVGAAAVATSVLVAVTLTPALLGLLGRRMLPRKVRDVQEPISNLAETSKPMSTFRAVASLVIGVVVLGVIALPGASMRLGLPDGSSEPEDSTQYQAYKVVADKFGPGVNGPLVAVAELPSGLSEDEVAAATVTIGKEIMALPSVVAVAPAGTAPDGSIAAFQVIPAEGPSSVGTEDLVHDLRDLKPAGSDGELAVAGLTSGNIDISEKLAGALPLYLTVVIGLSLLIMMLVFRSILVPLIATGGFILSLFAAFGAVVAIYQWGWLGPLFAVHAPGPILSFLPTILVGVLFGLAMDYQLFLVSGMREAYVHGASARKAITEGVRAGRAVVTAAAIIMISVFGGFVFSDLAMVRPIGFGLAIGVLVDAFAVRMVLVPALMHLVGDKAWWLPAWLDRILPNVDVEGSALERHHGQAESAEQDDTPLTV